MNSNFNTLPDLASDKAHTMNKATVASPDNEKSLESWIWDAAVREILEQLGVGVQPKRTAQ